MKGKPIGYLYREQPDNDRDSGWRVFSGLESQEFADDPSNFAMYNATTVVGVDPKVAAILGHDFPATFERDAATGEFVEIADEP